MKAFLVVFVLLQATFIYSSYLPNPYRCQTWDTACVVALKQSMRSFNLRDIPALGGAVLDPFVLDYIKHEQDGLTLQLKNSKIEGLNRYVLDEYSANTNSSAGRAKFHTDLLITGLYKADGSLLYMPVKGTGEYSVLLKNMEVELCAPELVINNVDGVDYVEATDYTVRYDVKDDAEFRLNDHYYGNSILSDFMNYLVNYNWKFVSSDFGKNLIAKIVDDVAKTYKNSFSSPPMKFLIK